jgi:hypothetical protein
MEDAPGRVEPDIMPCDSTLDFDEDTMKIRAEAVKDIEQRTSEIEIKSEGLIAQASNLLPDGELALCEMITYLFDATILTRRVQGVMDALQQMAANEMTLQIKGLSRTTLPKVILASSELYQSIEWLEASTREICGHVKEKSHQPRSINPVAGISKSRPVPSISVSDPAGFRRF